MISQSSDSRVARNFHYVRPARPPPGRHLAIARYEKIVERLARKIYRTHRCILRTTFGSSFSNERTKGRPFPFPRLSLVSVDLSLPGTRERERKTIYANWTFYFTSCIFLLRNDEGESRLAVPFGFDPTYPPCHSINFVDYTFPSSGRRT